jgi:hypothetical protein
MKTIAVPMTHVDLDIVADRLSESTRQELLRTATEQTPGIYAVALTEARARDLAAKAANLGLVAIATTILQVLDAVTV